jgi:hypothetical protein
LATGFLATGLAAAFLTAGLATGFLAAGLVAAFLTAGLATGFLATGLAAGFLATGLVFTFANALAALAAGLAADLDLGLAVAFTCSLLTFQTLWRWPKQKSLANQ